MTEGEIGDRPHDETRHRQHEQRRHHALEHTRDDLLRRDKPDRNWRQQPVLDLLRPAKVLNHRQGNRLNAREGEADRQHSWQERRRVAATHEPHLGQQIPEYDHEHERLHRRSQQEEWELPASDSHVASEQCCKHR